MVHTNNSFLFFYLKKSNPLSFTYRLTIYPDHSVGVTIPSRKPSLELSLFPLCLLLKLSNIHRVFPNVSVKSPLIISRGITNANILVISTLCLKKCTILACHSHCALDIIYCMILQQKECMKMGVLCCLFTFSGYFHFNNQAKFLSINLCTLRYKS